ncbi:response regulator transcription factor [Paracoccus tegillarcae]|uniref:HTH luxR-type domain-containing protein n=1 Tax=Paracoccus tegillarcae TaxID=1529068 RepID=A0A2K9F0G0_9RHOB|nr:response regulator transcription factor [Paracoccus tegillarcae]AUH32611.1 hypothetical protein CUV01_03745 [Paracoccus tegillarcae]
MLIEEIKNQVRRTNFSANDSHRTRPAGINSMTIVALNDVSFTATEQTAESDANIVFVGNQFNFSGSLIAATSQELGQIASAVVHSFSDFRRLIAAAQTAPAITILDEPTMRGLSEEDRDFLLSLPDLTIGLAFCNAPYAVACYQDEKLRLHLPSMFPLNVRLDIWLSIIKLIAHGGNYICPEVIAGKAVNAGSADDCSLTQRQLDVLRLVADGQSNKRIAAMLGLSIHTVKLHLHNANLRLGARNRTEAAMRYRAMQS